MTQNNGLLWIDTGGNPMSKIICDVCGTTYQDTSDHCPICGYSRDGVRKTASFSDEMTAEEEAVYTAPPKKQIFDFDEENPDFEEEPYEEYEEEDYEQYSDSSVANAHSAPAKGSVLLIIVLVIIITLLLLGIGFLLFRYYLPNQKDEVPESVPVATTEAATSPVEEETTEPSIPCTSLVLTSGVTELNKEGQYWLLHVTVLPEDTTDELIFVSEDENVVTVNEHGRVTAVGEGETFVYITCGEKQIRCRVVVNYSAVDAVEEAETSGTEPVSVEHETLPEMEEETETPPETTQETEPAEKIVLKLEEFDVSSNIRGVSFELKLDCDLKPEDVTWLTLDSSVAIVKNGVVTTIGPGRTKIVAQYQGQQVECIIRCNF